MKHALWIITISIFISNYCYSQNIGRKYNIDVIHLDSLTPGFRTRYNIIKNCKRSDVYKAEESILQLKSIMLQIEKQEGLFDDINYFEAIRTICDMHLQLGNFSRIDSVLYATGKYLNETYENPLEFPDYYKIYRAASWIESRGGRYDTAIELLEKSIKEETDTYEYLSDLQDLAICYLQNKQLENFSTTAKEAIQITDTISKNEYTSQLILQSNRLNAYLYISNKEVEKGIQILESLAFNLKDNNKRKRFHCTLLSDLCALYVNTNQIDKYIQAKKEMLESGILSKEEKLDLLESLVGAQWLLATENDIVSYAKLHNDLLKEIAIEDLALYTPTRNQVWWPQIAEKLRKNSYLLNRFHNNKEICALIYDNQLFLKNQFLSSDYMLRQYVHLNGDSFQKKNLSQIDSLREHIVYYGADEEFINAYTYLLSYRETDLMNSLPIKELIKGEIKTWKDIASSLKDNEIAVEITDSPVIYPNDSVTSQLHALIVTHNCDMPCCVKLGNYYEIADELRMLFSGDPLSINQVYSTRNNAIYRLLWGKLKRYCKGKNTVFISSNTYLSFVNLGALLSPNGVRVSEELEVQILSSTSEIPCAKKKTNFSNAALFGIDIFGKRDVKDENLYNEIVREITERGNFQALEHAVEEVNTIESEMNSFNINVQIFSNNEATESNFRSLNGNASQIIHIATHCFNITNINKNKYLSRLMAISHREAAMIGTGIIFANANSSWNNNDMYNNYFEDGILLSEDISRLNLNGCELLVLSGCQSGEGRLYEDGIFGLQRAFKLAGVKSLLLSLWNVNDMVAKEFMTLFYKALFQTNDKYKAYLYAQNEIRNKYNNPYYWAPFIIID